MPEKISRASLSLKIIFISVFFMMIGAAVVVHVYNYDDFTALILRFLGSENKLQQFRASFLTPQKFTFLRIVILCLNALLGVLTFYIRIPGVILFFKQSLKDFSPVFQNLIHEIKKIDFSERLITIIVFLIIAGFHLFYFFRFPMFIDEAFSYVHFVNKGFLVSASYYPGPNNHIFYSELCVFTDLFLNNPLLVMRLPALAIGLALSFLFFLVLKKYFGFEISLIATIIFSLSEQTNFYSSQGRGYILITFFVFLSLYSMVKVLFDDRKFYRLLFVLSSVLGFYTLPVFLYPFISLFLWSLVVIWKKRNRNLFFKATLIYSAVVVLVLILYFPVLLLNPAQAIFGNTWVSSPADFYNKFPEYIVHLNSFWWGEHLSIVISIIALTGLFWLGAKQNHSITSATILFLFVPLLMIFIQKILPFERVWLYYLLFLSVGLSYIIMKPVSQFVRNSFQKILASSCILGALIFYTYFNFHILEHKTFSYYKELDHFLSKVDSMHVKNIKATNSEYNTFLRLRSLEENNSFKVLSDDDVTKSDLLIMSLDQPLQDSTYSFLFQNSYVKAYKAAN